MNDKILSILYMASNYERAIGSKRLEIDGIENFDVTDVALGHLTYRENLKEILDIIGYNT